MKGDRSDLVKAAEGVRGEFGLSLDFTAAAVGAALLAGSGKVYTGVCIDLACGLGFCAEASAVAEMLKNRETRILRAVAVGHGGAVIPPCGRCREMMAQINPANLETEVLLPDGKAETLRSLLPENWIENKLREKKERKSRRTAGLAEHGK